VAGPIELQAGADFGADFRVVRKLGEGAMGAVYEVEQKSTKRLRALKLLHPGMLGEPGVAQRFKVEAVVGASIESEHIVEVIAAGTEPVPWLAMELLDGEDLDGFAQRTGPLPRRAVLEILDQLCHGLGDAHRQGIVHRDLKPQNIFLARPRRKGVAVTVKILDFGIAKILAEVKTAGSETRGVLGSPLWMAPEQADPEHAPITPATDVWALGLTAFWLLTGRYFWKTPSLRDASVMMLFNEIMALPLASASARAAEYGVADLLPSGFDAWFARCLVRDPRSRFQDATSAFAQIEQVFEAAAPPPRPALAPPPRPPSSPTLPVMPGSSTLDMPGPLPAALPFAPLPALPFAPLQATLPLPSLSAIGAEHQARKAAKSGTRQTLTFAVVSSAASAEGDLAVLCRQLEHALARPVGPRVLPSYDALIREVEAGRAHLIWAPPRVAIDLEDAGLTTLDLCCTRGGQVAYHAALFTQHASTIETLADLKGRHVAWVDAHSSAGYLLPRMRLVAEGFDPDELFGRQSFLGTHAYVAGAVLAGEADVGATYLSLDPSTGRPLSAGWLDAGAGINGAFILATAGPIPSDAIVLSNRLPAALKGMIVEHLMALPASAPDAVGRLLGADGFASPKGSHFEALRALLAARKRW
jgi:phosphate/phosphite/phosphonate ABC transporter binding protein